METDLRASSVMRTQNPKWSYSIEPSRMRRQAERRGVGKVEHVDGSGGGGGTGIKIT